MLYQAMKRHTASCFVWNPSSFFAAHYHKLESKSKTATRQTKVSIIFPTDMVARNVISRIPESGRRWSLPLLIILFSWIIDSLQEVALQFRFRVHWKVSFKVSWFWMCFMAFCKRNSVSTQRKAHFSVTVSVRIFDVSKRHSSWKDRQWRGCFASAWKHILRTMLSCVMRIP